MQGSLNGMHVPFIKTDTGPLALRLSSSKNTHYGGWLAGLLAKKKKNATGVPLTHNIPIILHRQEYTYTGHVTDTHAALFHTLTYFFPHCLREYTKILFFQIFNSLENTVCYNHSRSVLKNRERNEPHTMLSSLLFYFFCIPKMFHRYSTLFCLKWPSMHKL